MRDTIRGQCVGADFCQELSGQLDTEFHRTYGACASTRIIGRSQSLCLLVDMSPLCVGHLLIVSEQHYLSFAGVMREHGPEVKDVLDLVFSQYQNTFGEPVVLEHGSSLDTGDSGCITHAHWHLFPLDLDAIHKIMLTDGLSFTELAGVEDLAAVDQGIPYFFAADRSRQRLYDVERMRRQYLRSVAGELLGIPDPEWDYAVVVRKEFFWRTMYQVINWHLTIE
jgi:diadenosine tetraphosphate (Ap4A) HIT family hydrolase